MSEKKEESREYQSGKQIYVLNKKACNNPADPKDYLRCMNRLSMCDCKARFGHDNQKLTDCIFGEQSEVQKDDIGTPIFVDPKAHFYGRYHGKSD